MGLRMSEHQLSLATIWKFQIVPREVPGQKRKGRGGIALEQLWEGEK